MTRAAVIFAILSLGVAVAPTSGQTFTCLDQGSEVERQVRYIQDIVTLLDPRYAKLREVSQLPQGDASDVSVTTNKRKCSLAGEAYQSALPPNEPAVDRTLIVIEVGRSHYVVLDPNLEHLGELTMVFDKRWTYLVTLVS